MSITSVATSQSTMVHHQITLSALKQNAQNAQAVVGLLEKAQQNFATITQTRGQQINISA